MKIVTISQMRKIEEECARIGLPSSVLMENAGKAVAEEVKNILNDFNWQKILFLIGPGNNGGDGLVAARYLHDWGLKVKLCFFGRRSPEDINLKLVRERNITCIEIREDKDLVELDEILLSTNIVIDALFGTGKSRPLSGSYVSVLEKVTKAKKETAALHIIALDLPSGVDADSGAEDPACLFADSTITLGFPKWGLFKFPGAERAGKITIADIGIPGQLAEQIMDELITEECVRLLLPKRSAQANKGSFGKVLVVAGSVNYIGAAYLACSGAMRVGAGLVTLATAASLQPILASKLTEVTYLPLNEANPGIISIDAARTIHQEINRYNVLLMGCGMGQNKSVIEFMKSILFDLGQELPSIVLDADALNSLAKIPGWWRQLADNVIITPHAGEMARLMEVSVDEVQSDRVSIAKKAAYDWHKTVVLKGAHTVVAAPDGRSKISSVTNPGLASAGTGDVLAGVIAALLAQGLSLYNAATLGVYLHGEAGEVVRKKLGDTGMIASDLLPMLPLVIKQLKEKV
ncbi:MAG: NAD(P)H-hydrate dehydratase [Dehalococcoidales bacterium]|nr:NAD(P)H-hydrate dehydratase [Dehalococcoidales bacterium]